MLFATLTALATLILWTQKHENDTKMTIPSFLPQFLLFLIAFITSVFPQTNPADCTLTKAPFNP